MRGILLLLMDIELPLGAQYNEGVSGQCFSFPCSTKANHHLSTVYNGLFSPKIFTAFFLRFTHACDQLILMTIPKYIYFKFYFC